MKKVRTGVLPRRPTLSFRLNSGSRNGSHPPHGMSSGRRCSIRSSAAASLTACGSPNVRAAANANAAGPDFSESISSPPKCATEGVPAPAALSKAGVTEFRFTGIIHAKAVSNNPAVIQATTGQKRVFAGRIMEVQYSVAARGRQIHVLRSHIDPWPCQLFIITTPCCAKRVPK